MATPPPPGIYVPVPTFFLPPSAPSSNSTHPPLDLATQAAHALHLARCGIRGLVLLGSSGEAIALTAAERSAVIAHVRAALHDAGFADYPLIAGTATQGIEDTVEQLQQARTAGAQWGLVLAPGYFASVVGGKGLEQWYAAVAERSEIPVMIYHYPGVSNSLAIPPSTFHALAAHPNIVGCKLSHGNLSHTALIASPTLNSNFATFTGLGQQLLPVLSVGGAGAIDGLAGMYPRTVVALYDGYVSGTMSRDEMRELQVEIAAGEELIVRWSTVGVKEGVSRVLGFGARDGTRLPMMGGVPEAAWAEFEGAYETLRKREEGLRIKAEGK